MSTTLQKRVPPNGDQDWEWGDDLLTRRNLETTVATDPEGNRYHIRVHVELVPARNLPQSTTATTIP